MDTRQIMKVLLIGSGGREHALAWKISQSPLLSELYIAPGNAGTAEVGKNVEIDITDFPLLRQFALENGIDLTVVGPEAPLTMGIADYFAEKDLAVFGPTAAAARLEGSKKYAKDFLQRNSIPTAKYSVYSEAEKAIEDARQHFATESALPLVIKADGLAAGKGVIIARNFYEAAEAINSMLLDLHFGSAGREIVIEEFLTGPEVSLLTASDGRDYVLLQSASDYKRIWEGDTGLNTGGMGSVSPSPYLADNKNTAAVEQLVKDTFSALEREEIFYQGILYFGLMMTEEGPKVLEFNCRFGDPETQALLPRFKGDFLAFLFACARGELRHRMPEWVDSYSVCVILASEGYPGKYMTGYEITGLGGDDLLFHAGTATKNGKIVTAGGRVIACCGLGENFAKARATAYAAADKVNFTGKYFRRDIGDFR